MKLKFLKLLLLFSSLISFSYAEKTNTDLSFYTGTFDVIVQECDEQTNLLGIEHKNWALSKSTLFNSKPLGIEIFFRS